MAGQLNLAIFAILATVALLQSSVAATTYQVGDNLNWVVPGSSSAYANWAANKTFTVGDILVFNFRTGSHDVTQVTKQNFDACNGTNPISSTTTGPANITLQTAGEHYFICSVPGHCLGGQKLSVNVTAASSPAPQPSSPSPTPVPSPSLAPEPTATPSPTTSPAPSPSRESETYIVGDAAGWGVLPGGANAYASWASNKTFFVGDVLVFNFVNGTHDVVELTKENYESCNTNNTISLKANPPVRITLATAGEHFFTCSFTGHCPSGQKLAINVTGDSTATPPSSATSPSSGGAPSPGGSTTPTTTATPPASSGAASLSFAGLSATFLSIAFAMWY